MRGRSNTPISALFSSNPTPTTAEALKDGLSLSFRADSKINIKEEGGQKSACEKCGNTGGRKRRTPSISGWAEDSCDEEVVKAELTSFPPQFQQNAASVEHAAEEPLEDASLSVLVTTYLSYFILILVGHIRDCVGKVFKSSEYKHLKYQNGYAPINSDFTDFFTRRLYRRIRDCWNRPITKVAGRTVHTLERFSKNNNRSFTLTGNERECLNLSSYNYLGFAQSDGPCADASELAIRKYGTGVCAPRMAGCNLDLHNEVEDLVARFLGVEAAMIVSMGFATNSTTLPALCGKGSLIISDEYNHSSLVFGSRLSGADIRVFKHNDMEDLERVIREAISQGQPRTHRPWKKILLVVEGLYSMEGSFANMPKIVELKKKYKLFVYLDEAHSIGALGPNGRGICDYFGIDTKEIDIMMGTFTKSFGAAGGYIGGKKEVIDYLRMNSHGSSYAEAMSPAVAQQVMSSMKQILEDEEGKRRIKALARNCRFFSRELRKMGFIIYGHEHSPVIPLLLFHPCKIAAFSREMLARGIAVVVVGYPATPIISSRVRFCISASHTIKDLQWALKQISEVGDRMQLKVSQRKYLE